MIGDGQPRRFRKVFWETPISADRPLPCETRLPQSPIKNTARLDGQAPVRSWKRVKALCKGNNEMFLMDGDSTLMRLKREIDEAVERGDFGEGAFGEGPLGAG